MVIVEDFDEPQVLGRIAQKLLDAISQPFRIEDHDIYVTSSIGIRGVPGRLRQIRGADEARGRRDVPSKELGRNTYQFLDADLAERRLRQHTLETALRGAEGQRAQALLPASIVPIAQSSAPRRCCDGPDSTMASFRRRCSSRWPRSGLIRARRLVLKTAAAQCVKWRKADAADDIGQPVGEAVLPRGPAAADHEDRRPRLRGRHGSSSR